MPNRPLTDAIDALTSYANSVTGESDTNLPDAVRTLADGYGQGGGDSIWASIVDRTVTEIDDKDGVCKDVSWSAFHYCTSLTSVVLPAVTSVGVDAFTRCSKLSSVDLPSATTILNTAFSYCTGLSAIDLPVMASIGKNAFNGCSKLATLILRKSDSICKIDGTGVLAGTPIKSGTGYIYVPASLIERYKTATNWSTFAAQFRALEDYTVDGTITGDLDPNKI